MVLSKDISSFVKRGHLYGKRGDHVLVVDSRGGLSLVQGKSGLFWMQSCDVVGACHVLFTEADAVAEQVKRRPPAKAKAKVKPASPQISLF